MLRARVAGRMNKPTARRQRLWIVNVFRQIAVDHKRDINSQNDIIIL